MRVFRFPPRPGADDAQLPTEAQLARADRDLQRLHGAGSADADAILSFNPAGPRRQPPDSVLAQLDRAGTGYRLHQHLCLCRQPDYLQTVSENASSGDDARLGRYARHGDFARLRQP